MTMARWTQATAAVLTCILTWQVSCAESSVPMADITSPVFIQESPENEAVIVKLPDGTLRIFYTLQPSGTELRSISSTDGGLTWGDSQFEIKMPGQAVWCMQAWSRRTVSSMRLSWFAAAAVGDTESICSSTFGTGRRLADERPGLRASVFSKESSAPCAAWHS